MAQVVHRALWKHRHEIAEPRDVLRLEVLADHPGEVIAVALADCVADGVVHAGGGRMVIEKPKFEESK